VRIRLVAALLLVLSSISVILTGCGGQTAIAGPAGEPARVDEIMIPPGQPIVIGVSSPITGPSSPEGIEDTDAVITSVIRWKAANGDQILGHDIEVLVEDDGCTEDEITRQAAQRLLATPGLVGVIGPSCSAGARAALPLYDQAGVVSISGSATESQLASAQFGGRFFFRTAYRNSFLGMVGGLFIATELGARSAYLLDDGELYGEDLTEAAAEEMEAHGITVVRASTPLGTVDFGPMVEQVLQLNPDFVGFAGFNPDASLFYRQLRDAGYEGFFGAGDAAASVQTFVEPVGDAAEGVYFVGCPLTLRDDFLRDYSEVHGDPPNASAFTAQYADATTVLLDALAEVTEARQDGALLISSDRLRDAIRASSLPDGLSGQIMFDESGDRFSRETDLAAVAADLGVAACQVQDGKLVNLFP
jgi:branched-chain amino acid transport system substrate-binding protein